MNKPDYQQIEALAYHIWESRGRPAGQQEEHWHEAENRLRKKSAGSTAAAPEDLDGDVAKLDGDLGKQPYEQEISRPPKTASNLHTAQVSQANRTGSPKQNGTPPGNPPLR